MIKIIITVDENDYANAQFSTKQASNTQLSLAVVQLELTKQSFINAIEMHDDVSVSERKEEEE